MTEQSMANEYRIREWAKMISAHKQSGKKVDEWCADESISHYMYYYRLKKVRKYAAQELMPVSGSITEPGSAKMPLFAALPMPRKSGPAVTVHIGTHLAEIHNGADIETVEGVLRTLTRL